jgi:hypothetical protein
VPDGRKLVATLSSHHYLLMTGHRRAEIETVCQLYGLAVETI